MVSHQYVDSVEAGLRIGQRVSYQTVVFVIIIIIIIPRWSFNNTSL
jgi:hypothetical protein